MEMILNLVAGLALFLFGMNTMGDGLEKLSGGKMEKLLEKITSSTFKGFLVGTVVTALIQSSSATTVMVVGFVNSGIMKLSRAVGVIMGANLGTTVTAWLLSLSGLKGDSVIVSLLKPSTFSPVLAFLGIVLVMFCKSQKKKDAGSILIGFAVLMIGMSMMSEAVEPLADNPEFKNILLMFSNPFLGVLVGIAFTAIIQSSSASVGILQAFSATGSVTYASAIPIILGQNIGACVPTLISCIGAKKSAKRAALVHLYFSVIGKTSILIIFYVLNLFLDFKFMSDAVNPVIIAIIHTVFSIAATAIFLPLSKWLEKLAYLTIPDKDHEDDTPFLDERFLNTPSVATSQCNNMCNRMALLSEDTINDSFTVLASYSEEQAEKIRATEQKIDVYEDVLGTYLVKLCSKNLSPKDSALAS